MYAAALVQKTKMKAFKGKRHTNLQRGDKLVVAYRHHSYVTKTPKKWKVVKLHNKTLQLGVNPQPVIYASHCSLKNLERLFLNVLKCKVVKTNKMDERAVGQSMEIQMGSINRTCTESV